MSAGPQQAGAPAPVSPEPLSDEWCARHFDYLAPEFARELHPTLERMRSRCPVTRSDARGGFWVLTRYEDVLRVAQDWETFSSELGVGIPGGPAAPVPAIPEHVDPPLQRVYKKLISASFTPAVVRRYEAPTRRLVTALIDEFIEAGSCDFMTDFAQPFPGLAFFDLVLGAPRDELAHVTRLAQRASVPSNPDGRECWQRLAAWIGAFVERRRAEPARGDVVDAILAADIEGRPITETEILGMLLLLILGGLETTAGVLGQAMIRFAGDPSILTSLRREPDLVPAAVEELLRLDGSFVAIGRTVRHDTELGGYPVTAGEKVLISWAAANRDEAEFANATSFDPARRGNRHLAFGAGPHRCVGSNLARLNLQVAVSEISRRLLELELTVAAQDLPFHTAFNRSPLAMPISFRPGARLGQG